MFKADSVSKDNILEESTSDRKDDVEEDAGSNCKDDRLDSQ